MNDHDHDLEQALAALRPRAISPTVLAAVARALDAPAARRGVIIAWSTGLSALAALFVVAFVHLASSRAAVPPAYRFVRADQSPTAVEYYRPVRLEDGSFARPVHVRWANTTRWEDAQTNTRLINYQPGEQLALVPLEVN